MTGRNFCSRPPNRAENDRMRRPPVVPKKVRSATAAAGRLPSPAALLELLRDNPAANASREIARAFGLGPGDRPALRAMLRAIQRSGEVVRGGDRRFEPGAALP